MILDASEPAAWSICLSSLGQGNRYQQDGSRNLITKVQELTSSKELWFRAAVIAVPIAGGLILVLLIMLALRMLRSENKRLQDQRQQMLSRLHYSFHGHHSKKGQVAKLDLECVVPVSGHENCCLTCDKMRQADLSNDKILSLVHWGMYSGHGKLEFVWQSLISSTLLQRLEALSSAGQEHFIWRQNSSSNHLQEAEWPSADRTLGFLLKDYLHRLEYSQMYYLL